MRVEIKPNTWLNISAVALAEKQVLTGTWGDDAKDYKRIQGEPFHIVQLRLIVPGLEPIWLEWEAELENGKVTEEGIAAVEKKCQTIINLLPPLGACVTGASKLHAQVESV
ncbi:hypothetical protein ACFFU8_09305 [Chromobacterium piscinae]|uniref:hypothetical protein n=1 Tax=Chromobacterium piscinae TaxID=686831 RepID=UPI001E424996|nr:hypothetical protein [Chromobacterium piscinae]MCD5327899.1 hypothetical protein [Chromobacterium piscinae]